MVENIFLLPRYINYSEEELNASVLVELVCSVLAEVVASCFCWQATRVKLVKARIVNKVVFLIIANFIMLELFKFVR